ncbi:wall-associated receptor kinase 2-like [Cucumis melo var. makuwa]|uniref:Wall-associated receptor kinase 2-like n=1 Tax=Cucumis melo var. makuwa TaxID=1194695 RepID=A0A5A7SYU3_CUCMM|nr:wall-associated receptor kinase 2-like [Cucumis melo var. makuwa]
MDIILLKQGVVISYEDLANSTFFGGGVVVAFFNERVVGRGSMAFFEFFSGGVVVLRVLRWRGRGSWVDDVLRWRGRSAQRWVISCCERDGSVGAREGEGVVG